MRTTFLLPTLPPCSNIGVLEVYDTLIVLPHSCLGASAPKGDVPVLDKWFPAWLYPPYKRGNAMTRIKRPKAVHQLTSAQFDAMFPVGDDEACKAYLVARRWPNGVHCPRCGNADLYDASSYKSFHWQCRECAPDGYRFSCIAGTIFENTNKPLRDWFKITHLILTSKKGMSARQLGRYMGFGSVKTAWLMGHKIRTALIEPETKLGGIVEVDETFVGGKAHNRHWVSATACRAAQLLERQS
jgi:transposase-like zinc ribbon protein